MKTILIGIIPLAGFASQTLHHFARKEPDSLASQSLSILHVEWNTGGKYRMTQIEMQTKFFKVFAVSDIKM